MSARRHLGRVSSTILPSEASPYDAICKILGASLRELYGLPQGTPTYMESLVKELEAKDEEH